MFLKYNQFRAILVAPIVLMSFATSCSKPHVQKNMPEVKTTPVIEKIIPYSVPIVGQVIAKQHVQLRARIIGFLTKQNFIEGSYVKKGQLLYEIQKDQYVAEKDEASAAVLSAQASYDNAMIEYNRQKNLLVTNATSQKNFDNATEDKLTSEANLLNAKAKLALAELNLSYTQIFAPFDGRIGASTYYPGNLVDLTSNPLGEVVMIDPIWIAFEPREELLVHILQNKKSITHMPDEADPTFSAKGISIKLILSNGAKYSELGVIDFVNNQTDPQTGTIQMRATFKNTQQLLLPGNYVNVIVEHTSDVPSLLIPQVAMQNDQIGTYVFTVNKSHIIEQKYIDIGQVYGSYIVVKNGLCKDALVVTEGILNVKNGTQVAYTVEEPNVIAAPDLQTLNGNSDPTVNK